MAEQPHGNPDLLLANLVARVICAFIGILLCWVPLRLLIRNGEFAGVVLIIDVVIMNVITIINSSIWHTDDWRNWWDGQGLCDIEVYITAPMQTMYAACVFTIMFNLAQQMRLKRAAAVPRDRGALMKRNLIQAAIIFPIPIIQLAFTYFDLAQRYIIGTVVGCIAIYDQSWPKSVVYDCPAAIFSVMSVPYAVLLWRRYHVITKQTQRVLKSNSEASIRASRTRRRLYNMCLSILVVYLPVTTYFTANNIRETTASFKTYDFERIRLHGDPYPWSTILFTPSWIIPSAAMNLAWIPIATTVVIVAFFGMTIEARAMYRQYASLVGLDVVYDRLKPRLRLRWRWRRGSEELDTAGGTQDSGNALLSRNRNPFSRSSLHSRRSEPILPTIEHPESILSPISRPLSPTPTTGNDPHHSHDNRQGETTNKKKNNSSILSPPIIPPRGSSLRPSFAFRTPTLQSIRRSLRALSLPGSRNASRSSAADPGGSAQSRTESLLQSRTGLHLHSQAESSEEGFGRSNDAIPMFPLPPRAYTSAQTTHAQASTNMHQTTGITHTQAGQDRDQNDGSPRSSPTVSDPGSFAEADLDLSYSVSPRDFSVSGGSDHTVVRNYNYHNYSQSALPTPTFSHNQSQTDTYTHGRTPTPTPTLTVTFADADAQMHADGRPPTPVLRYLPGHGHGQSQAPSQPASRPISRLEIRNPDPTPSPSPTPGPGANPNLKPNTSRDSTLGALSRYLPRLRGRATATTTSGAVGTGRASAAPGSTVTATTAATAAASDGANGGRDRDRDSGIRQIHGRASASARDTDGFPRVQTLSSLATTMSDTSI